MLSYIHSFHAGNHGDILKHIVFSEILEYLLQKEKPFTVIDSHSAQGKYSLKDENLLKTNEAKCGIEKLLQVVNNSSKNEYTHLKELSYLKIENIYSQKKMYAGSPELARIFLRENDNLILNELHPKIIELLKQNCKENLLIQKNELPQTIIQNKNAKEFLESFIPPKIKRGCVIIDPSYEDKNDFIETASLFKNAFKKWKTATFVIWYPLLEHRFSEIELLKEIVEGECEKENLEKEKFCVFELEVKDFSKIEGLAKLYGSGVLVVNPPFTLNQKMQKILAELKQILYED